MYLKRLYNHASGEPVVSGVKVLRAGREQKFSQNLIDGGLAEGWLSMIAGRIIIHAEGGDREYKIARMPGYYCCHCNRSLPDAAQVLGPGVTAGTLHVNDLHGGLSSPDSSNPAGYRKDNFYFCVNESTPARPEPAKRSWADRLKAWR